MGPTVCAPVFRSAMVTLSANTTVQLQGGAREKVPPAGRRAGLPSATTRGNPGRFTQRAQDLSIH